MARMYSGSRGKSGSNKPLKDVTPTWIRYKPKEVELLVMKLAKEKHSTSEIGIILRDIYGIPRTKPLTKKSISQILGEKNLLPDIPDDLMNLMKKNIKLRKHLEANHVDQVATRGLHLTDSKIMRLVKYYKKTKRLPLDWKYDPEKVRLLIS